MTVFLQGAAGDALPLEAFRDDDGAVVAADNFGERLALEAAHAIADADPWPVEYRPVRLGLGDADLAVPAPRRRRSAAGQPLRTARRIVSLPLLDLPSVADLERELAERKADLVARGEAGETRVTMNPIRYHISWLETTARARRPPAAGRRRSMARSGRRGSAIARSWAPRARSSARSVPRSARHRRRPVTIFAGYSQGSLGYVATPDEYPHGGYEPAISHRGYGQPAPFSTEVAGIIERTALELLQELFA